MTILVKRGIGVLAALLFMAAALVGWRARDSSQVVKEVAQSRDWPEIKSAVLHGATAAITTKWKAGQLHFRLSLDAPSKLLDIHRTLTTPSLATRLGRVLAGKPEVKQARIEVKFQGEDGFILASKDVPWLLVTEVVNESGQSVGFTLQDSIRCDLASYNSITTWSIASNINSME